MRKKGKYYSDSADMLTMAYRYTVLNSFLGIKFNDAEPECTLPREDAKEILAEEYSEQKERLLFLVASGVLKYKNVKHLIIGNVHDFLDDVVELEEQLMSDEELSFSILEEALLVSSATKLSDKLVKYDFNTVLSELKKHPDISVENGLVSCRNKEYEMFLKNIGLVFVRINDDGIICKADKITEDNFYVSDVYRTMLYLNVYDKIFGKDFIEKIIGRNDINGDNIQEEYERYVIEQRLTFDIHGYIRRRNICGSIINHFDYDFNRIEDNKLIESTLTENESFSATITLSENDVKSACADSELVGKALNKYKRTKILPEDFLAEIFYNGVTMYFVYSKSDDKFRKVDSSEFSAQLFDFDKIWSVVRKASAENKIMLVNGNLSFPYIDEILPEEQIYALAMAKEQYVLKMQQKKSSSNISTLKKLIAGAKNELDVKNEEKIQKQQIKQQKFEEAKMKLANRIQNSTNA